jgi:hypothetical protein
MNNITPIKTSAMVALLMMAGQFMVSSVNAQKKRSPECTTNNLRQKPCLNASRRSPDCRCDGKQPDGETECGSESGT